MPHLLQMRIGSVRRTARLAVVVQALARSITAMVAVVAMACMIDYVFRIEDRGLRLMLTLAVTGVAVWCALRFLAPAFRSRWSDIDLALQIERCFPPLRERLATALDFLNHREDDASAGSSALRREMINDVSGQVARLDLRRSVQWRHIARPIIAALLLVAGVGALWLADSGATATAIARLANPWGNAAWPKQNHLAFSKLVRRVAVNQPFSIELIDVQGAPLPDDVRLHYRFSAEGQEDEEVVERMTRRGAMMIGGIANVTRPFSYRAEGGDDDSMPWIDLDLIEPATVRELQITLHYPEYTRWEPAVTEPHIRALVGTHVAVTGQTTKPLRAATIKIDGVADVPLTVSADGFHFELPADAAQPFVVARNGAYMLDLEDRDGFHGGQGLKYDIRAIEDRPPTVVLEQPSIDTIVTADAELPIAVLAKDDLGLKAIELRYTRSDRTEEGEQVVDLFNAEDPQAATTSPHTTAGESRHLTERWSLAPLGLKPGVSLTVFAAASDRRPEWGTSQPRRLTIVSPEELQEGLAERQGTIVEELNRLLALERQARTQLGDVQIQLGQVGKLAKTDVDQLQQAELTQRQVERGLTSPTEGVPAQIESLLAELDNNKVADAEIQESLRALRDRLGELNRRQMPAISQNLTTALKQFQNKLGSEESVPVDKAATETLESAAENQDQVIAALESLVGQFSQWDSFRRFQRDVAQIRREQESIGQESAKAASQTLTQELRDLKPQQLADLKKLAERQREQARALDKVLEQMDAGDKQLAASDAMDAETVRDAVDQARQQGLSSQMREAGGNLEKNQIGQAATRQQSIGEQLDELMDILSNRRENQLDRLVQKMREAQRDLNSLAERQAGLRKKAREAREKSDPQERKQDLERLAREQRQLQQEAERMARALKRLKAEQAGRSLARSGQKMGQSGQAAEQGSGQGAEDQAAAAEQDLQDAQRELAESLAQAEQDLANEQIAGLPDKLRALHEQEQRLLTETRQYAEREKTAGRLTRSEAASVSDLADEQAHLREETAQLANTMKASAVIALQLERTVADMNTAAISLARRDLAPTTAQAAERRAADRLQRVMEALSAASKQKKEGEKEEQGGQGGPSGGQQGGQQGGNLRSLAELRLLRAMQEDVNARTIELDQAARVQGGATSEQQRQFAELTEEQGKLANLLLDMISETNPDVSPDADLDKMLEEQLQPGGAKPAEPQPDAEKPGASGGKP